MKTNQKIRLKQLLNKIKNKYGIKDKVNLKIINKKVKIIGNKTIILNKNTKTRRMLPWMSLSTYYPKKIPPEIEVYPKNMDCKIEYIPNPRLEHVLAHELVHLLIRKHNEEDIPKESKKILLKINKMIDDNGYS